MTEEVQAETPETTQPTLEELAAQFKEAQTQPVERSPAIEVPKFESQDDFQNWTSNQLAEVTSTLNETQRELNERKAKEFIKTQETAVNEAVKEIKASVDLSDMLAEGALHYKYSHDESFKKIFDNRDQNPDAYKRALGVLATELKAESQWAPDPQSQENTRALQELQKNSGKTATQETEEDRIKKMPNPEFGRYWENLIARS